MKTQTIAITDELDEKTEWTCTDPDNRQYGRQFSKTLFQFKERGEESLINVCDYRMCEIEKMINHYGYTMFEDSDKKLQNIFTTYPKNYNWIIAECIFEQESGLY